MLILRARNVLPLEGAAIIDGGVALDGPMIVGCAAYKQIRQRFGGAELIDLEDCVLLPGMVNAHTHLELSGLRGKIPYTGSFTDWIHRLVSARDSAFVNLSSIIIAAVRESLAAGVTTVADISANRQVVGYLKEQPIRKVCFAEAVSFRESLAETRSYFQDYIAGNSANDLFRLGLSPHGPYSASAQLYELAAELAGRYKLALTTHLAETLAEEQFLTEGTGEWFELLRELNLWPNPFKCPYQRPIEYFLSLKLAELPFLLAHVNYVTRDEIAMLARTRHSVVYCPRSHAFFEHPAHPFGDMLAAGINVALGTDSLASNNTLSILDEMRFLHSRFPEFPVETIIRMGTMHGAKALGLLDKIGTLEVGKEADLIAIALTGASQDPIENILQSSEQPRLTAVRGMIRQY